MFSFFMGEKDTVTFLSTPLDLLEESPHPLLSLPELTNTEKSDVG